MWTDTQNLKQLFHLIYEIFYSIIKHRDDSDSLYLAQFLDFFLSQLRLKV